MLSPLTCLLVAAGALLVPAAQDEAPPPPPLEQPMKERIVGKVAAVLRPMVPSRYATGTDGQVVAVGALGVGLLLGAAGVGFVAMRMVARLPQQIRKHRADRVEQKFASRREAMAALLTVLESSAAGDPSLHEALVVIGVNDESLRCLDAAASLEQAAIKKFPGWPAVLDPQRKEGAQRQLALRKRFIHERLKRIALAACKNDPQLGKRGLEPEVVEGRDAWDIELSFVRPDGLGATLDEEQRAACGRITAAIRRALGYLGNPYAVPATVEDIRAAQGGRAEMLRLGGIPGVAVLLFGPAAFRHASGFFTGRKATEELEQALVRHLEVIGARADAEGVAAWLAQRGHAGLMPGLGGILAAVGGAALKPQAASLRLRQSLPPLLKDTGLATLLGSLGGAVAKALAEPALASKLTEAARMLCCVGLLEDAHRHALSLQEKSGGVSAGEVTRRGFKVPSLSEAIVLRNVQALQESAEAAGRASERLIELLRTFSTPEFAVALRSQALVGAVVAALEAEPLLVHVGFEGMTLHKQARAALSKRGIGPLG